MRTLAMSELRWALLILGILFLVVLALWERRRPRQASGGFERFTHRDTGGDAPVRLVRDPPLTLPEVHAREPAARAELPTIETSEESAVPVLEPAEEHFEADMEPPLHEPHEPMPDVPAADPTDEDTIDDLPAIILDSDERVGTVEELAQPTAPAEPRSEPPAAGEPMVEWPAEHERRILALRLVAPQRERFAGRSLRQALAAEGFLLGQFAIFHKPDEEHRAVLSAASLTRPGTFDMDTMDSQHYGGLSLFAVLPGPMPAGQAFEELVFAARNLNERLHGVLQDEQGTPLTPSRIAQLREELRTGVGS